MNIMSWSPFQEMDDLFSRYRNYVSASGNRDSVTVAKDWRPIADISETDKEYVIKAELPDVERKDVHVSVDNGQIMISGDAVLKVRVPKTEVKGPQPIEIAVK